MKSKVFVFFFVSHSPFCTMVLVRKISVVDWVKNYDIAKSKKMEEQNKTNKKYFLSDENHIGMSMYDAKKTEVGESASSPSSGDGGSAASNSSDLLVPCPCHSFFGDINFCPPTVAPNSKHPSWAAPVENGGEFKGLLVNNSLTGTLMPFRPAHGNHVLWYTCGPTVYDSCHMGHARAYLTLDILRRIMEDYFG